MRPGALCIVLASVACSSRGEPERVLAEYRATAPKSGDPGITLSTSFVQLPEGIWIGALASTAPVMIEITPLEPPKWPEQGSRRRFGLIARPEEKSIEEHCTEFGKEDGRKDECVRWMTASNERRVQIQRLLVRRYEWKRTSFQYAVDLPKEFEAFRPKGVPQLDRSPKGYALMIPWAALPAQSSLTLDAVRLSLILEGGRRSDFHVLLNRPREFWFSDCRLPLIAVQDWTYFTTSRPAFFFPQQRDVIDVVYGWGLPLSLEHGQLSGENPVLLVRSERSVQLGEDEYVCGPILKYRHGAAETPHYEHANADDGPSIPIITEPFRVVRLPAGGALLWSAPEAHTHGFAAGGVCGAAPAIHYAVLRLVPLAGQRGVRYDHVQTVHSGGTVIGCRDGAPLDFDVEASADLRIITEYRRDVAADGVTALPWKSCRFLWNGNNYSAEPCHPSQGPRQRSSFYEWIKDYAQ